MCKVLNGLENKEWITKKSIKYHVRLKRQNMTLKLINPKLKMKLRRLDGQRKPVGFKKRFKTLVGQHCLANKSNLNGSQSLPKAH